jgi:hypothetical protein
MTDDQRADRVERNITAGALAENPNALSRKLQRSCFRTQHPVPRHPCDDARCSENRTEFPMQWVAKGGSLEAEMLRPPSRSAYASEQHCRQS